MHRKAVEAVMWFAKADESNKDESFDCHQSDNPSDMIMLIKPRNKFTFVEMVTNT